MPRRSTNRKMTRLNLAVSEDVRDRIETLRDETDAESVTEVIRRALAVYDKLISKSQQGGEVFIRHRGVEREVLLVP